MCVYMCLDCYEIYDKDKIYKNDFYDYIGCPKTNCVGELIEIDELMIPTIKILNQKGYYTKFCCSGHYYDQHPNGYIMFEEDIDVPNLPKGWNKEEHGNYVVIRSSISYEVGKRPTIKDFKKICDNAKTLVDWAIKLPYNEECY